jgi:hypothetical protein
MAECNQNRHPASIRIQSSTQELLSWGLLVFFFWKRECILVWRNKSTGKKNGWGSLRPFSATVDGCGAMADYEM